MQNVLLAGLFLLLLSGCAGVGAEGERYLLAGDYDSGAQRFRELVRESPDSQDANFWLGRFLLAGKDAGAAVSYLRQAASGDVGNIDYQFWLGVAYGETMRPGLEEAQYQKVLSLDPGHISALRYLGNNFLNRGRFEAALESYNRALELRPKDSNALYNRALSMHFLGRSPEEKIAWLEYLWRYPAGPLALRATEHLNRLGEYSYRNQRLWGRQVTLTKIWFQPFQGLLRRGAYRSLNLLGEIASKIPKVQLQVVMYQKNNKDLAQARAVSVQDYLVQHFPALQGRVQISWLGVEDVFVVQGQEVRIDESVRFFLTRKGD